MGGIIATAAVDRFGLGAMPGELAQACDPRRRLHPQLRREPDLTGCLVRGPSLS